MESAQRASKGSTYLTIAGDRGSAYRLRVKSASPPRSLARGAVDFACSFIGKKRVRAQRHHRTHAKPYSMCSEAGRRLIPEVCIEGVPPCMS